jgi:hypothetical protein
MFQIGGLVGGKKDENCLRFMHFLDRTKLLISATMTVRAGGSSGIGSVLADTQGHFF